MRQPLLCMIILLSVFVSNIGFADTLIIKESRYRLGYAYAIEVNGTPECVNGARNISNSYINSDWRIVSTGEYYAVSYTCMTRDGVITASGTLYQVPYSSEGVLCLSLSWGDWSGVGIDDNKCPDKKFTTKILEIGNITLYDYIRRNAAK